MITPQGTFLTHKQLKDTYQIDTHFLTTLQIQFSLPNSWMKSLRKLCKIPKSIPAENTILINNKSVTLDKVTCKDFYWHLINLQKHKPNNIKRWCELFQHFEDDSAKTWPWIFKLPFSTRRNNKIQTFQYKILHWVILCNK